MHSAFSTDKENFLSDVKEIVATIRTASPRWYALNLANVKDALDMHKCCIISGDGGIGKSYFVKCFEEELEKRQLNHLCLYGKFLKNIDVIDFDEIKEIGASEEYVFVFDAVNEISDTEQIILLDKIKEIITIHGVRVVLTYRNHDVSAAFLSLIQEMSGFQYEFPGVSFESALEWLQKLPVADVSEYIDVLYSNNPFLLSKLKDILQKDMSEDAARNNISRYTYIYEQYIRRSLDQETWRQTKAISKWMYENNTKSIPATEIAELISNPDDYITRMEQRGFLRRYPEGDIVYCSFVVDSLADYLIARSAMNALQGLNAKECVSLIANKLDVFYGLHEMLILMLFDKYAPDYPKIYGILRETRLLERLSLETLAKVHFSPEDIPAFQKVFVMKDHSDSLLYFAGYVNRPFNCTNYLNQYYLGDEEKQTKELTRLLSKNRHLGTLRSRLKNALYYICRCKCSDTRLIETFYTALWCSSAGNMDVRRLATKLLFEILQRNSFLIDEAISVFPKIKDQYIQESLIHALSMCPADERITCFFNDLWTRVDFIKAKSIRRISVYLGRPYQYISLVKENLFHADAASVSEVFARLLYRIDIMEKNLLPFQFWGLNSFQSEFLAADKNEAREFNDRLASEFSCVRDGDCNGWLSFERVIEEHLDSYIKNEELDGRTFLASMETVFRAVFQLYDLPFDVEESNRLDEQIFGTSILKKCTCIAIDLFYGSIMCNYFSCRFGTYNSHHDSIGYEVYDPLEYDDGFNIQSPISVYQHDAEKMGNLLLKKLEFSQIKDEKWWKDRKNAEQNVLALMSPISYGGFEWVTIAGRIMVQDNIEKHEWRETYNWFCCTSPEETLRDNGEERYLTIELQKYAGNVAEYTSCTNKPWLCKSVPAITYESDLFEDTRLVLPPAQVIHTLDLTVNSEEMSWQNEKGECVIICNNNRASYFKDSIIGTVFIRKDAFEQLRRMGEVKIFAYSEKFLAPKGCCEESAYHFEVCEGKIVKAVANYQREKKVFSRKVSDVCQNCKFGFNKPDEQAENSVLEEFLKMCCPSEMNGVL